MDDVIVELRNVIGRGSAQKDKPDVLLMNSAYEPILLDSKNFHPIRPLGSINDPSNKLSPSNPSPSRMLFVDGGNSVIFDCPDFCFGLVRIFAVSYEGNKRINRSSKEFYVLINELDSKFTVKTFPESVFNDMIFDPADESLRMGRERCDVSRILSVIRRFAELDYAYSLDSEDIDYILLDGTLEARYPHEMNYLGKLCLTGKACSLSKTCSLTTRNGFSITKKLLDMSLGMKTAWYYNPVVKNNNADHPADLCFLRLNERSPYVFRFELQQGFRPDRERLFSALSSGSADPIFLGYPYGFIDVDQNARISEEESSMLKMRFAARLGTQWNELSKSLNSMNAHDILDKIRF